MERKAKKLINHCYRIAFDCEFTLVQRIEALHAAITCCDYVSRFSVHKSADLWNELSHQALSSGISLTSKQIYQMLEIAKDCEGFAPISVESKESLKQMLGGMAESDCL